jgi:hypothetical protein
MDFSDGVILTVCLLVLYGMAKMLHIPFWKVLLILTAGGGASVGIGEFM